MKEFDFLPEWYKDDQKRKVSYLKQYIALGCIFVVMVVWNLVGTFSITQAAEELSSPLQMHQVQRLQKKSNNINKQISQLSGKARLLDKIQGRIDISSVLAEISFLLDERVVLSEVDMEAVKFNSSKTNAKSYRLRNTAGKGKSDGIFADVRFKVVMKGLAADAGDVAKLICDLESSAYFCQVNLAYSRSGSVNKTVGDSQVKQQVTEFQIECYLANYREEN